MHVYEIHLQARDDIAHFLHLKALALRYVLQFVIIPLLNCKRFSLSSHKKSCMYIDPITAQNFDNHCFARKYFSSLVCLFVYTVTNKNIQVTRFVIALWNPCNAQIMHFYLDITYTAKDFCRSQDLLCNSTNDKYS